MQRIIVDVDAGADDSVALFLLLHADKIGKIKLESIICSAGNTTVDHVIKNVVRLLETAKRTDVSRNYVLKRFNRTQFNFFLEIDLDSSI